MGWEMGDGREVVRAGDLKERTHRAGSAGESRRIRWAAQGFHLPVSFEFVAPDHAV